MKKRIICLLMTLALLLTIMPAAVFASDPGTKAETLTWERRFSDVKPGSWYEKAVAYMDINNLINGTSDKEFSPDMVTNRAMYVTILYRIENQPKVSGSYPFEDAAPSWAKKAITWAKQNDIVKGTTETTFSPNDNVTREQVVTMLYRYETMKQGKAPSSDASVLEVFPDADKTSKFAKKAMAWAVENGIINGANGMLMPGGEATRAQIAQIFMNLLTGGKSVKITATGTPPVGKIVMEANQLQLVVGDMVNFKATVYQDYSMTNKRVKWSSSNTNVVRVWEASIGANSSCTISALAAGTATITATVDGVSASCTVTVSATPPVNKPADLIKYIQKTGAVDSEGDSYIEASYTSGGRTADFEIFVLDSDVLQFQMIEVNSKNEVIVAAFIYSVSQKRSLDTIIVVKANDSDVIYAAEADFNIATYTAKTNLSFKDENGRSVSSSVQSSCNSDVRFAMGGWQYLLKQLPKVDLRFLGFNNY